MYHVNYYQNSVTHGFIKLRTFVVIHYKRFMQKQTTDLTDQHILFLIAREDPEVWEQLYDRYASVMYGIICNLVPDRALAAQIFEAAFLQLKEKNILAKATGALCPRLMRYTYNFTIQQLNRHSINPLPVQSPADITITQLLHTHCNTLQEAATVLNITVEEAKTKLHLEFCKRPEPAFWQVNTKLKENTGATQ